MSFIEIVSHDERNVYQSGDSKIYYRRFDGEIYNKMHKKWTKKSGIDRRTGQPQFETDTNALNNALLDWLILDWEGIHNPNTKKDVPCDEGTKIQLPNTVKLELINLADSEKTHGDDELVEAEKKNIIEYAAYIKGLNNTTEKTISCEECMDLREAIDDVPDCDNCKNPVLWQSNFEAWRFYQLIANQLVYDFPALLPMVFQIHKPQMTHRQAVTFLDKLVCIHSAMTKRDREDGK